MDQGAKNKPYDEVLGAAQLIKLKIHIIQGDDKRTI